MTKKLLSLFLSVVVLTTFVVAGSTLARNVYESVPKKVVDPYTGKIVDYDVKRVAAKPVAWGDDPRTPDPSSAPYNQNETPRTSLGSAASPTGVSSPGLEIYKTYMDDQYRAPGKRMIDFRGKNPWIHFTYSRTDAPGDLSRFGYNVYDPVTGDWPRGAGVGCVIEQTGEVGQHAVIDVNSKGFVVVGGADNVGGPVENHYYYQTSKFGCIFGAGSAIDQTQYNANFLNTTTDNHLWEPVVEVQEWAGDTITHVLGKEQLLYPDSNAEFGTYTINYFRKVGVATAGTWTGPVTIDTINNISFGNGTHNGALTASRVSAKVAVGYVHWHPGTPLKGTNKRYDNDIFYRISTDAGLTWGAKTNLTNYSRVLASYTAFLSVNALYDHQDFLHLVWDAGATVVNVYADASYFWGDFSTNIWHWSNRTNQIAKVHNAQWGIDVNSQTCGFGSPGTGYVGFYTMSECEGKLYIVFSQYLNYFGDDAPPAAMVSPGNLADCAVGASDKRYAANGELYMVVSKDLDGILWDAARNLTNTFTPKCDSAGGLGGLCMNDTRSSLSRYGMAASSYDTGVAHIPVTLKWPVGDLMDKTPPADPPDTGNNFIMLMYLEDHFPAPAYRGIIETTTKYGRLTLNPLRFIRLACVEPVSAPRIFTDTTRIGFPAFTKAANSKVVTVTVSNEGNTTLNVSQIGYVKTTNIPKDWLGLSTSALTVPAGIPNTATFTVTLNKTTTDFTSGTINDLSGYIFLKSDAKFPRDSINIVIDKFLVADTVLEMKWDTVSTNCGVRLMVSNNGDMGDDGLKQVNLDFVKYGGECDTVNAANAKTPTAEIYLYDGGPVVVREITPGITYSWTNTLFNPRFLAKESFKPILGGVTGHFTGTGLDGYRTPTFVNRDSTIGVKAVYYAPTGGGDSCNFVIVQRKYFPYKGTAVSAVTIGEQIDWDIPSDTGQNSSAILGSLTVYQRGVDTINGVECGGTQTDSSRYGAALLLGKYSQAEYVANACANDTKPYGIFSERQDTLFKYDSLDGQTDQNRAGKYFWGRMSASGMSATTAKTDLRTVSTYYYNRNFSGGTDTVTIYSAVASVHAGKATGVHTALDSSLLRAFKWYNNHLRPTCTLSIGSCCVATSNDGRTGNVDNDPDKLVDISDLIALVNYLYVAPFTEPTCLLSANIDGDVDNLVDISDLIALVNYLYVAPFPATSLCK